MVSESYDGWEQVVNDHPLFYGNPKIIAGTAYLLNKCTVNPVGKVEVVAEWKNGHPLVAIRYDLSALITSITYYCGNHPNWGNESSLWLVVNALTLFK